MKLQLDLEDLANNLGDEIFFIEAAPVLREIRNELRQLELNKDFDLV